MGETARPAAAAQGQMLGEAGARRLLPGRRPDAAHQGGAMDGKARQRVFGAGKAHGNPVGVSATHME